MRQWHPCHSVDNRVELTRQQNAQMTSRSVLLYRPKLSSPIGSKHNQDSSLATLARWLNRIVARKRVLRELFTKRTRLETHDSLLNVHWQYIALAIARRSKAVASWCHQLCPASSPESTSQWWSLSRSRCSLRDPGRWR